MTDRTAPQRNLVAAGRGPAVQYLRMSSDHQHYSLDNQRTAIAEFAAERGYDVVATYIDEGKSGLTLRERNGLNKLLHDVTDPQRRFSTILVLDVSRWGRFQDPDQHGAYEFLCREMGVNIEYVGEPFENDGSSTSSIMKGLKRIMAGEYSRELSAKVLRGSIAMARRGRKLGGPCLYGLRRLVLDADGNPLHILEAGEQKFLRTNHVVLVHGPKEELAVIRRIFRLFVVERQSLETIVRTLNRSGIRAGTGRWTAYRVKYLLKSEQMIGVYVYGRRNQRLKGPTQDNPESEWIRIPMMKPIVSEKRFREAALRLGERHAPYSTDKMLRGLRRLLKERGAITRAFIEACPYLPSTDTIRRYFGSVTNALAQIGYTRPTLRKKPRAPVVLSEGDALEGLRRLYRDNGFVSAALLRITPDLPASKWYRETFGSLSAAYAAAGILVSDAQLRTQGRRKSRAANQSGPNDTCVPPLKAVVSVSHEEFVIGIRRLHAEHGFISADLINTDPQLPSIRWVYSRYASLLHAYQVAGLSYTRGQLSVMGRRRTSVDRTLNPAPADAHI